MSARMRCIYRCVDRDQWLVSVDREMIDLSGS